MHNMAVNIIIIGTRCCQIPTKLLKNKITVECARFTPENARLIIIEKSFLFGSRFEKETKKMKSTAKMQGSCEAPRKKAQSRQTFCQLTKYLDKRVDPQS